MARRTHLLVARRTHLVVARRTHLLVARRTHLLVARRSHLLVARRTHLPVARRTLLAVPWETRRHGRHGSPPATLARKHRSGRFGTLLQISSLRVTKLRSVLAQIYPHYNREKHVRENEKYPQVCVAMLRTNQHTHRSQNM